MKRNKIYMISGLLASTLSWSACRDFVEVPVPDNQLNKDIVFTTEANANVAALGMYGSMSSSFGGLFNGDMTLVAGLAADELQTPVDDPALVEFFKNNINPVNRYVKTYIWDIAYQLIYLSNAVIEGIDASSLNSDFKKKMIAEAKFIRAFGHFYLTSLFGDVPYVKTTDYRVNNNIKKNSASEVLQLVMDDLKDAYEGLSPDYSNPLRTRVNKSVAAAFMARVALYQQHWEDAERYATQVIGNTMYDTEPDLSLVFKKESSEVIWQLNPAITGLNTLEGYRFVVEPGNRPDPAALTSQLAASFETGDKRRQEWVLVNQYMGTTFYQPYKYKVKAAIELAEYYLVFRLAEQYLIRAEARAHQGKTADAVDDVDVIRHRAGLSLLKDTHPGIGKDALLLLIERERKHELFAEWGHRWLDLKRTGRAGAVLSSIKQGWSATDVLFPIPRKDILLNGNLLPQNDGY